MKTLEMSEVRAKVVQLEALKDKIAKVEAERKRLKDEFRTVDEKLKKEILNSRQGKLDLVPKKGKKGKGSKAATDAPGNGVEP